jgi:5'-nucleotidase
MDPKLNHRARSVLKKYQKECSTPLILLTNDDGIHSPGLHAVARAVCDLGEIFVAAPQQQFSNSGRSHPPSSVRDKGIRKESIPVDCSSINAYALASTPAHSVMRAMVELVPRLPDLVISGINYGENMGSSITISGTIGAAIEAACFGVPALAVSLQTPREFHYTPSNVIDFSVAASFARRFARAILSAGLPPDVDALKVDVPDDATPDTPWRVTRVSRQSYYVPITDDLNDSQEQLEIDYEVGIDKNTLEPDSDIKALAVDRIVSVCPISIDMTSRTNLSSLERSLERGVSCS